MFPAHVKHAFADRHHEFWEWAWDIELETAPRPFVGVWPRGGGKSTSAELATASLGLRGKRRYALYVRETQDKADQSVANIAALLEARSVDDHYPDHADRMVTKFGASKGWRRNRLRTAGGFTVDALGLDTAARGAKVDEQRPDLIIFDDIDDKHDSIGATAKKIKTLTTSIIPAGSNNVAILAIQNLIIPDGVFSRLVDGRADFLAERIVSGPFPAVDGLITEDEEQIASGVRRAVITGGTATWDGQDLHACQVLMDLMGLASFKLECQHDVSAHKEGLALRFTDAHLADLATSHMRSLVGMRELFGGLDFGAWRFAANVWAADPHGVPYCLLEYYSQREDLSTRAKALHVLCASIGIDEMYFWGDAANPQDIMELNAAWERGWTDERTGAHVTSKLRVVAVAMENKLRSASVERLNRLMTDKAFRIRRTIGDGMKWRHGWNASTHGTEMKGSRLLWEIKNWRYPVPKEGEAQEQDPDDHTADGADAIAAMRYAIMSWWSKGNPRVARAPADWQNSDAGLDPEGRRVKDWQDDYGTMQQSKQKIGQHTVPIHKRPTRWRTHSE